MGRRTNLEMKYRKKILTEMGYEEIVIYNRKEKRIEDPYIIVNGRPLYVRILKGPDYIGTIDFEVLLKSPIVFELYAMDDKVTGKLLAQLCDECGGELEIRRGVRHTYYVVNPSISRCVVEKLVELEGSY